MSTFFSFSGDLEGVVSLKPRIVTGDTTNLAVMSKLLNNMKYIFGDNPCKPYCQHFIILLNNSVSFYLRRQT